MELQVIKQNAIVQAFSQTEGTKSLFEKIATEARSVIFDMSVKKERDALKSFAYNLSRTKTTVDNYGKELVSEIKKKSGVIDADRKFWRDNMELLQDEIRKPLTDFENAEKERINNHNAFVMSFVVLSAPQAYENKDSLYIKDMILNVENTAINDSLEEFKDEAELAKFKALEVLRTALANREKYEAEQAELERLRIAEQQRQQQERDTQIAREATEKAQREAEEKARFEAEKVAREKLESEQREARLIAEKEASELREVQLQQQAEQREKQAKIDRENAVVAERQRIENERITAEKAQREADHARLANREHMRSIHQEVSKAMLSLNTGLSDIQIKDLITAIAKNQIPHVSIKY